MRRPFVIFALPRSRTAWLARFLSYRSWICYHQAALTMRSMDDVAAFFDQHNVGVADPGISLGWRVIDRRFPQMRRVVIRRDAEEAADAMLRVNLRGSAIYDEALLRRTLRREAKALDQISAEPGVLTVAYTDLDREDACAAIFEHCLPFRFQREWWEELRGQNIQADVPSVLRYFQANRPAIDRFKSECWRELRRMAYDGAAIRKEAA